MLGIRSLETKRGLFRTKTKQKYKSSGGSDKSWSSRVDFYNSFARPSLSHRGRLLSPLPIFAKKKKKKVSVLSSLRPRNLQRPSFKLSRFSFSIFSDVKTLGVHRNLFVFGISALNQKVVTFTSSVASFFLFINYELNCCY